MKNIFPHLVALVLCTTSLPAIAATTERLSVVSNGEVVGSVIATIDGNRTAVDYSVDDNGRGPKHHEEIVEGPGGIPVSWTIKGTSLMGGPVEEHYEWSNKVARWKSQADSGAAKTAHPGLYIVNDDSPWAEGVYARAALVQGNSVDVLPGGKLVLTKIKDMEIGSGARAVPVTVYRLGGIQLAPSYLMLDQKRRLFASFGAGGIAIRQGYEKEASSIIKLGAALEVERMRDLQARLAHRFPTPIRIRNVRIFDPRSGTLGALSTVVVMRDQITQIIAGDGGTPPSDEVLIEGDGGTLYPGLHDMHSHTTLSSGLYYLAAGVTATRDMGNKNSFLQDLLPRLDSGEIGGPRVVPNGFIEGRSPYSAHNGFLPATLDEALRDIHWYADRGYFEIKIYNSMNPDWVKPMAAEAHRLGMGVTGHVPAFDSPDRVIRDGYDTIAHVNQLMLGWILKPGEDTRTTLRLTGLARGATLDLDAPKVRATVALMKEHGTALDTTAVIVERLMLSRAGEVAAGDADYLSHMPIGYQRYRKRSFVPLKDAAEDKAYRDGFAKVLEVMGMLHHNGISMLPGTDDATGFTVQRELELYTMAGMTPAEALRAGTLDSAAYLKNDDRLVTIEKGKLADMVLVAGDPTRDIKAIKRPRMVLKGGAVYFPSEIYTALGIKPFAAPPALRDVDPKLISTGGEEDDQGAGAMFGYPFGDHFD
jgi:imidazolonepropionase-like amidohydrolase